MPLGQRWILDHPNGNRRREKTGGRDGRGREKRGKRRGKTKDRAEDESGSANNWNKE